MSGRPPRTRPAGAPAGARNARAAADRAHAPYSKFRVGCVLVLANGEQVRGANLENASYPLGICAERTALHRWHQGSPGRGASRVSKHARRIVEVWIYTPTERPTSPCGLCRDALTALAPDAVLHAVARRGRAWTSAVSDLLPARASKLPSRAARAR